MKMQKVMIIEMNHNISSRMVLYVFDEFKIITFYIKLIFKTSANENLFIKYFFFFLEQIPHVIAIDRINEYDHYEEQHTRHL